jgi:septal ring factor EnvC (AmiA/AmiB activator)
MKAFSLSLLIILCALFCVLSPVFCQAASPQDEYKKIQKEIRKQKEKLDAMKKRESSILTEIDHTSRQLETVEGNLRKYRNRLITTETKIVQVENEIAVNRSHIERHREWLKKKLRAVHKYGQNSEVVMLFLNAEDIAQLMRAGKYLQYIAVHEHRLLRAYIANLESLTVKEQELIALRKELIRDREKVQKEEETLAEKKKNKELLLSSVKKEKSSHTKLLKELEEASQEILEIIRDSERAGEKSGGFVGKGFTGLKGKLPWPVEGRVLMRYGSQKDPQFNTPIFRSGTYIQSGVDSLAKAVHSGKVVFAEWFKGYGQLVIVNHGDGYHTLYGSLSVIFTKVGDIIKGKQAVGRVGNSGIVDSPGLYFELRYKGKPLDPLQWLQRR